MTPTRPEPWLNPDPLTVEPEPVPISRGCAWRAILGALVVFWTIVGLLVVNLATPRAAQEIEHPDGSMSVPVPTIGKGQGRASLEQLGAPHVPGSAAGLQPRRGRPNDGASSLPAAAILGHLRPDPSQPVVGSSDPTSTPAPTPGDASLVTRSGTWAWADPSHGARYLAIPPGPGWTVRVCGPSACLLRVATDAGPALYLQRRGRIGDLNAADWQRICGVPLALGLCQGTWTIEKGPALPATDAN